MSTTTEPGQLSLSIQPIVNELNSLLKECNNTAGQLSAEVVVVRVQCSTLLNELQSCTTNVSEKDATNALRRYVKVVLDLTYIKENQLVEEEFPVHDGYERMQWIVDMLKKPEQVVQQVLGPTACKLTALDKEITECLHWRRGALCYMYCHTVWINKGRLDKCHPQIIQCLEEGVSELQAMLAVRRPVSTGDDVVTNSRETARLLAQGIFSDTHVLALMYAGEMCYWHMQLSANQSNASSVTTFNQSDASKDESKKINQSNVSTVKTSSPSDTSTDIIGSDSSHGDGAHQIDQSATGATSNNTASCATQTSDSENKTFDSKALGMQFLQRYVEIVKGPLKASGWDSSKAEDMIKQLGK